MIIKVGTHAILIYLWELGKYKIHDKSKKYQTGILTMRTQLLKHAHIFCTFQAAHFIQHADDCSQVHNPDLSAHSRLDAD